MVTVNLICKRASDKKVLILSHLPTLKRLQQKMEVVRFCRKIHIYMAGCHSFWYFHYEKI